MTTVVPMPATHRDLLDVHIAAMATVGKDGRPQITAIWFFYDENEAILKLWLLDSRQKARNLRANPKVTLFVMDPRNMFRTLEIRCRAEVVDDPEQTAMKGIAQKYQVSDFSIFDGPTDTRSAVFLYPEHVVELDLPPLGWESVEPR